MRKSRTWTALAFLLALARVGVWPPVVAAQRAQSVQSAQDGAAAQAIRADIDQLKKDFDARMAALELRLAALGGGTTAVPAPAATPPEPVTPPPVETPAPRADTSKVFNPDMAVIGNFLGAAGKNTVKPEPALQMAESEMSLQAVVDPYARADFFLAFGEQGVDIEEGFLTFDALPGGLLMKVGKTRAAFGKVNASHRHILPWADRPLVTQNLVGGEEGMSDAGISVARLVSNPWVFLEATGQVYRGDSSDVFRSSRRRDLNYVGHLRAYGDFAESTNLDLGASFSRGHNASGVVDGVDLGRFTTQLFGVDATLRWKPLRRAIYHSFIGRSEAVWSRREQPGGPQAATGFFVSGDYQLGRRWYTGLRVDRSGRADDASVHDSGTSLTLTYQPSEFSQVRGQVRRTRYAEGERANEFLFQFQFAIGAHAAHPF